MGSARCIGRIGALAVALGVGIAVTSTPAIGYAQPSSASGSVSGDSSSSSSSGSSGGVASAGGSSAAGSTATDAASSQATADGDMSDSEAADDEDVADGADDPAVADEADDIEAAEADVVDDVADGIEVAAPDLVEDVADDVEVADAEDGAAEQLTGGESDDSAEWAQDSSTAEPGTDEVSVGQPADGSVESALSESDVADDADASLSAVPEASSDSGGQLETSGLAVVADEPAVPSLVAPAAARATAPEAAENSSASTPTLRDVVSVVVRETAQVVVDALDWVLAASGKSYDDSELPWGLALLAGVRREIDRIFLAPYRDSLQANAALDLAQSPNLLVNPGAEEGDPSLSGNSAVSIPGWVTTGTPTAIEYGALRNSWPLGLSFPLPDLPSFMGYPKAYNGPPDGGAQMFGGGNVADSTLTQIVDLNAAAAEIDTGAVTYNLSGWLGGWLANLSSASVKVDFLDHNKTYLGTTSIGPVGGPGTLLPHQVGGT